MKHALIALALVLSTLPVQAQEPEEAPEAPEAEESDSAATPEDMQQIMEATFGAMVPMMVKMTEGIIDAQLRIAERPETATRIAAFKKNLYDALLKQGFSKTDALAIVKDTALPSATPAMK